MPIVFDDEGNPKSVSAVEQAAQVEIEKEQIVSSTEKRALAASIEDVPSLSPATFASELGQAELNRMVAWHQENQRQVQEAEAIVKRDPTLFKEVKDAILGNIGKVGFSSLDALTRVLNFDTALQVGYTKGFISAVKGEGTVFDQVMGSLGIVNPGVGLLSTQTREGISESLRRNLGFGDVLREDLNVPPGPSIQARLPQLDIITPSAIVTGIVQDLLEGRVPAELKDFGPTLTTRGAVGLALDILASPITYLSFGATTPKKLAPKAGRSVIRLFNSTALTGKELRAGAKALKATREGRAVLHYMDRFAASQLGQMTKTASKRFSEAFIPANDFVANLGKGIKKQINQNALGLRRKFLKLFEGTEEEARLEYFNTVFKAMKAEREAKELGKVFGRIQFPDPKLNKIHKEVQDFFKELAPKAGVSEEVLFENYIPSVFREIGDKSIKKATKKLTTFQRSKSLMRKEFVENDRLVRDPIEALTQKAVELMTIERINNGFIAKVVRKFGKTLDEATETGIDEFFPQDVRKFFKGTRFDFERIADIPVKSRVFLPNRIVEDIQKFASQNKVSTNVALKIYDNFTQQFKAWVTSIWPAFNSRNFMSNRVQRFLKQGWGAFKVGDDLQAVKILSKAPDLGETFIKTADGRTLSLARIGKQMKRDHIFDLGGLWEEMGARNIDKISGDEFGKRFGDWITADIAQSNIVKAGRKVGGSIEVEARAAAYIRAVKDGFSFKEAKKISFGSLFDYSDLTAFERSVMKRFFPFYTFGRKNFQLQAGTILQNPGRQQLIFKTVKDIRDDVLSTLSSEQKEALVALIPEWMHNSFAIPVGIIPDEGPQFVAGIGLPQEDFIDLFDAQGLDFRLNPAIKLAREAIFRAVADSRGIALKERYTVQEAKLLFPPAVEKFFTRDKIMGFVNSKAFQESPITKLLKLRAVEKTVFKAGRPTKEKELAIIADAQAVTLMRNLFTARFMSTFRQLGSDKAESSTKLLRFMTGVNINNINAGLQSSLQKKAKKRELGRIFSETGVGGLSEKAFTTDPRLRSLANRVNRQRF